MRIEVTDPYGLIQNVHVQQPLNNEQIRFEMIINARDKGTWFQYVGSHPDLTEKNMAFFATRDLGEDNTQMVREAKIILVAETAEDIQLMSGILSMPFYIEKDQAVFYFIDLTKVPMTPIVTWRAQ